MKSERTYSLLRRIKKDHTFDISHEELELMKQRELIETKSCADYGALKATADRKEELNATYNRAVNETNLARDELDFHNDGRPNFMRRKALGTWEERGRNLLQR